MNQLKSFSMQGGAEPITSVNEPADPRDVEYMIEINTSWRGTDSTVYFQIHGVDGTTGRVKIDKPGDTFEPDGDKFEKFYWPAHVNYCGDVGLPYAIEISAPTAKNWGVEAVRVTRTVYKPEFRNKRTRKAVEISSKETVEFPTYRRIGTDVADKVVQGVLFWADGKEPKREPDSMTPIVDRLWTVLANPGTTTLTQTVTETYTLEFTQLITNAQRNTQHQEIVIGIKGKAKVGPYSAESSIGITNWAEQELSSKKDDGESASFKKEIDFTMDAPPGKIVFYEVVIASAGAVMNYPIRDGRRITLMNPTALTYSIKKHECNTGAPITDPVLKLVYDRFYPGN